MRRAMKWLINPTLVMFFTLGYGLYLRWSSQTGWENWVAFSMVGLGLYSIILFFIGGIGKAMRGEKHFSGSEKLIYGYLGVVWVLIVLISIYLMAHN